MAGNVAGYFSCHVDMFMATRVSAEQRVKQSQSMSSRMSVPLRTQQQVDMMVLLPLLWLAAFWTFDFGFVTETTLALMKAFLVVLCAKDAS